MELKAVHANCSGCSTCRLACALENYRKVQPALGVLRIESRFPAPGDYLIHLCDQCGQCAEACPEEAIRADRDGVYRIYEDECTACMICADVCPYSVIIESPETGMPLKCTLCGACADACPRDAILLNT